MVDKARPSTEYARDQTSSLASVALQDIRSEVDFGAGPRHLRVLLISDGRPGHYRQSEGVVAALRRRVTVELDRVTLGVPMPLPKALLPRLGRLIGPAFFLRLIHGLDPARIARPHVVVSAGGSTLGANVALSRILQVPNVFSGSTRGYPLEAFRLVLSPYPHAAVAPNVVVGPKPTPFDPDAIPAPRRFNAREEVRGARVGVLVGGATPYANFGDEDWSRLARTVAMLASEGGCRVTVVTSPRSPEAAYAHLLPMVAGSGGAISVIDYRSAGPGSIEAAFDCDVILITSDSMSMMTEAAVSRRPAIALAPRAVGRSRDDEAVRGLVEAGWLAVLPLAEADWDHVTKAAVDLAPAQDNHLDRLADHVLRAIDAPLTETDLGSGGGRL